MKFKNNWELGGRETCSTHLRGLLKLQSMWFLPETSPQTKLLSCGCNYPVGLMPKQKFVSSGYWRIGNQWGGRIDHKIMWDRQMHRRRRLILIPSGYQKKNCCSQIFFLFFFIFYFFYFFFFWPQGYFYRVE